MRSSSAATSGWRSRDPTHGAPTAIGTQLDRFADLVPGVLLPVVLVLNPLVVGRFTALDRADVWYLAVLDLTALGCLSCYLAGRSLRRPALRLVSVLWLVMIPVQMLLLEISVFVHDVYRPSLESYAGDAGQGLHVADESLGWRPRPGAAVRHASRGNFDVAYTIDPTGRRSLGGPAITPASDGRRLHVFGDSFTFGHGVADHETYAARLQQRLGPGHAVLNYGVNGYGLEQMHLWLERHAADIRPGDLVLWAPISGDLPRSFIDQRFLCGLALSPTLPITVAPVLGTAGFAAIEVGPRCSWLDGFLGRSRLPLASLVNWLLDRWRHAALLANAERILARAQHLAAAQGARFTLVFLARPAECLNRAHVFDLAGLEQPHRTLLDACPRDPERIRALRFPADGHWTPAGHRWAATALLELIEDGGRSRAQAAAAGCPTCAP